MDDMNRELDKLANGDSLDVFAAIEVDNGRQVGWRLAAIVTASRFSLRYQTEPLGEQVASPVWVKFFADPVGGTPCGEFYHPEGLAIGEAVIVSVTIGRRGRR